MELSITLYPFLATFFKSVLFLTQSGFLIPFIVLGICFYDKAIFGRVLFISLFSMILNTTLKSIFQIPLPASLHATGWAYPSA